MELPRPWKIERVPCSGSHWLQVLRAGPAQGPGLLVLHGAAGCWHNFRRQIDWLQHRYRIVAPDLRGHGVSPWPGASSVDDFTDDVLQVVEHTLPGPFAILAHSFGGCMAVKTAYRLGNRVRGLALISTAGNIPLTPAMAALKVVGGLSHWVARLDSYWLSCHGSVARSLLWHTLPGWNTWPLMSELHVPTCVVAGRFDSLVPWKLSQRMADLLPQASFKCLPRGRHVPMWEHEAELQQELEVWLGRLSWTNGGP